MTIFYYFLRSSLDDSCSKNPLCTDEFLGDVGEFCILDGVGYYIEDYAVEHYNPEYGVFY